MPCVSWSRARRNDGKGPPPLRDDGAGLWGLPGLSEKDAGLVCMGNLLLSRTVTILRTCNKLRIPWTLENPARSRAWLTEPLQLLRQDGAVPTHTCFCQYGCEWKKPTIFLGMRTPILNHQLFRCKPKKGGICLMTKRRYFICSKTKRRHLQLSGVNKHRVWWTTVAQPYPKSLCKHIAKAVTVTLNR